jgi:hypothetical protein
MLAMRFGVLLFMVVFVSCGSKNDSVKGDRRYVIEFEKPRNIGGGEACNVDVLLINRVDPEELKSISYQIRESRQQYDKLWIRYFINKVSEEQGAWGSASFTPEFEMNIIGSTLSQDSRNSKVSVEGAELGRWRAEEVGGAILILYKKHDSSLAMKTIYPEGQSSEDSIWTSFQYGANTLQDGNSHGEYYIVEPNGNLGLYGRNGKFDEAIKL